MFLNTNISKMLFLFILMMSTLISISSNSWIGAWIGMEINLLSFIPQMMPLNWSNLLSSENMMKYFLIQSIASANFLFSMIMIFMIMNMSLNINKFLNLMLNLTLLMKMGAAPLHSWFPKIMENLNWVNCLILSTWQKLIPLMLISYCMLNNFILFFIITSTFIGSIMGLNQTSLRNIISYSSINHLGWMLTALMISKNMFNLYFTIYSFLMLNIIMMFNVNNFSYLNQIFCSNMSNLYKNLFFFNMMSLGGLPPFLGFIPKWMLINFLSNMNMQFVCLIMLFTALINLYYYIRIMFSSFMLNYFNNKWFKFKISKSNMKIINFLTSLSIMGLMMINFIFFFI
uniref:NADH dehydrogenase subunit 2 n=1 Tax=Psilochorema bidens TaxID=1968986 RepID=UPI0028D640DD|nr:NADH dehydrogenase subunit 2 [Psilochorema bidens]WMQ76546.1 NADH dehydrogenase subunit 2 [Psilochorema bidens]